MQDLARGGATRTFEDDDEEVANAIFGAPSSVTRDVFDERDTSIN